MSGFERILARVGGDALRDYCSSAIEDELKNLKTKMQSCLETVEKALEVQDAIQKLNVPLSETNVATFAAIQSEYQKFAGDLGAFIQEQRQIQANQPREDTSANRVRTDSVASSVGDDNLQGLTIQQRLSKLANKIQLRLSKKHSSSTWIAKNIEDMQTVAALLQSFTPEKTQRRELVLTLDHFISAVVLSPATTHSDFTRLDSVLKELESAPQEELKEFAKNSRTLVVSKLQPPQPPVAAPASNHSSNGAADERRLKRQRVEQQQQQQHHQQQDEFFVKVERQQQHDHAALLSAADSVYEVRVSDLPWGVNQSEVESYFGVAGQIVSVRMPTIDDGSTVGIAIVRFASSDGLNAALRLDGFQFQGKTMRVAMSNAN